MNARPLLVGEGFILFPKNRGARFPSRILTLCGDADFTARVARETFEIQTALGLVATGLGVTLVTAGVLRMRRRRSLGPARDEDR